MKCKTDLVFGIFVVIGLIFCCVGMSMIRLCVDIGMTFVYFSLFELFVVCFINMLIFDLKNMRCGEEK